MDTKSLLADMKARFSQNSAREYLRQKYESRLNVASQGGLWKADAQTIALLQAFNTPTIVLVDRFDNPVTVSRAELLATLTELYTKVMEEWATEWIALERKR